MDSSTPKDSNYGDWYDNNFDSFVHFKEIVLGRLTNLLTISDLPHRNIISRVKTKKSFLEKIDRKKYDNPVQQMTDIIGIRIVCDSLQDVSKLSELVKSEFQIDEQNSVDKVTELPSDMMGYEAIHYIVQLKQEDMKLLSNYDRYESFKAEIQIKTALQDTWANLYHNTIYKNMPPHLPSEVLRIFNLLSAVLELVDKEFQGLLDTVKSYHDYLNPKDGIVHFSVTQEKDDNLDE